jgi:hypothetical protein
MRIVLLSTAALLAASPALASTQAAAQASSLDGILFFIWWIACIWIVATVAKNRGRKPGAWIVSALFFNWIALLLVLILPRGSSYIRPERINPEQQTKIEEQLASIESGNLTAFIPNGVMPQPGEQFFWEQRAQYGQTQKEQRSRGSSPAVYIPLGHGIRMRAGGYSGSSQTVTNFAWGPMGTVFLSNHRVLFKTDDGNVAQAPFEAILTYDAYPDGLALNVNKIGVMQFKTGDPCLGALFLKLVRQADTPPVAAESVESTP